MDSSSKLLGSKCQIVVGVGPHAVLTGYAAYGIYVRVADTQIKSVTKVESDTAVAGAVTDETWESKALIAGEYISLEDQITSITLNAAADSVTLFLQPYKA
jgi:hypothetical protein